MPPDFVDGPSDIGLIENGDDFRFLEHRLAHGNQLARVAIVPESSAYGPSQIRGSVRSSTSFSGGYLEYCMVSQYV